jgi:hypothetical protein
MEQTNILRRAVETLERLSVPYMVVGSIAGIAYGELRFTQDIDILLALEISHVEGLLAAFPETEFYFNAASVREAVRANSQFNIIHPASANKIDFILPRTDEWGRSHFARCRPVRLLPDRDVMAAGPEDIILGKLWYYSQGGGDRHLRDIAGILRITGSGVNRAIVNHWASALGFMETWREVLAKADNPDSPPEMERPAPA